VGDEARSGGRVVGPQLAADDDAAALQLAEVEAMVAVRPTAARTSPVTATRGLTRRSVDAPNQAARAHRMTALKTV